MPSKWHLWLYLGVELVRPNYEHVQSYVDALHQINPESEPFFAYYLHELVKIAEDEALFLTLHDDLLAKREPLILKNGISVPRLPSITRWMWDGDVAGRIQLRWVPGTTDLPPYCLGHVGYGVFPWKRRRGYATQALQQILPYAEELGMDFVEVVTDEGNMASQRVIERSGGIFYEQFIKPETSDGGVGYRFRIPIVAHSESN